MRTKSDTAKKNRQSSYGGREARSVWSCLSKRLISDFEAETQDIAFLCLIASANGLKRWPEGIEERDSDARFLTFH
jgi:hypothetical protein